MLLNMLQGSGQPLTGRTYLAKDINDANTQNPGISGDVHRRTYKYSAPFIIIITTREEHISWHLKKSSPWDQSSFLLLIVFFISVLDENLGTSSAYAMSCKGENTNVSALHAVGSL